jgi:hypothetical protein
MVQWVEEAGESKGRAVMAWIRPHQRRYPVRKDAHFRQERQPKVVRSMERLYLDMPLDDGIHFFDGRVCRQHLHFL